MASVQKVGKSVFLDTMPLINGKMQCSKSLWLVCGGTSHMCHFWHWLNHASDGAEDKRQVSGFLMFWLLPQANVLGESMF